MNIIMLIAAFGGGLLGAAIGGVPAFVFTGLTVIAAVFGGEAGAPMVSTLSFGVFFGPHVAFGGAVAAAAYAKQKGLMDNGQDIVTPLFATQDAMVLIIGGAFGVVGYLIEWVFSGIIGANAFAWNSGAWTDTVALTVLTSGIIVRLLFTKSGIIGKYEGTEPRSFFPSGKRLSFLIVVGAGVGIAIGGLAAGLGDLAVKGSADALYLFSNVGVIGFGIAAISLAFLCMGLPLEGYHHVILPAGTTAVTIFAATQNAFMAIIGAAVMGIVTSLFGEFAGLTFNSYADSHIDPPATTIWLFQLINILLVASMFPATGVFA